MRRFEAEVRRRHGGYPLMVMMPPIRVVAAVPTFAHVPAANGNAVVKATATLAANGNAVVEATAAFTADGNAVVEATADLETTTSVQATTAAM